MYPGWDALLGGLREAALKFLLFARATLGVWPLSLPCILAERLLPGEQLLRKGGRTERSRG